MNSSSSPNELGLANSLPRAALTTAKSSAQSFSSLERLFAWLYPADFHKALKSLATASCSACFTDSCTNIVWCRYGLAPFDSRKSLIAPVRTNESRARNCSTGRSSSHSARRSRTYAFSFELAGVLSSSLDVVEIVEVRTTHVRAGPLETDDEVRRKDVDAVFRIDKHIGKRRCGVTDVLGTLE